MKIMEEDVVEDETSEMEQQMDKDCDFGNYIKDEDDNVSPGYLAAYYDESHSLTNNKKEPRRGSNPVEALVRHFKIFFPKGKRSKHATQSLSEPQQTGQIRCFSFLDSKIGKEFENFTMGHSMDFFTFDTEYIDENAKSETAPPLHHNKRTKIIGYESIFRNATIPGEPIHPSENEIETKATIFPESEEILPTSFPTNNGQRNEYLLPDGLNPSKSVTRDHYQNYSNINDNEYQIATDIPNDYIGRTDEDEIASIPLNTYEENRNDSNFYDQNSDGINREDIYNYAEDGADEVHDSDVIDENQDISERNQENFMLTSHHENSCSSGSTNMVQNYPIESFRHSAFIDEQFGNIPMQHKSMPSLANDPPKLPPIDTNRPAFRDEELKIFRSADVTSAEFSTSLKKGRSNSVFGKAIRRISSYFSLKKDKTWSVDPETNIKLNKF